MERSAAKSKFWVLVLVLIAGIVCGFVVANWRPVKVAARAVLEGESPAAGEAVKEAPGPDNTVRELPSNPELPPQPPSPTPPKPIKGAR